MSENNEPNFSTVRTGPSATVTDIRLLVLDLDGTIVDKSNHIRDSVAQAIHSAQCRGVQVAIATGRRYRSSLPAYDWIGSTLPLICYEGALIRDRHTGFVHRHWPLEPQVTAQILDCAERLGLSDLLSVHFYIHDDLYVSNLNDATNKYLEGSEIEPIVLSDLGQLPNRSATKAVVLSADVRVIARLYSEMKRTFSRLQAKKYKSLTVLEAFHPAVSKRSAVSYLVEEIMALRPENIMAIGDDFTDIGLLQYAGIGIAMGNAPPAVKACADWVTTTIDEDGVARAVEEWILRTNSDPALTAACAPG